MSILSWIFKGRAKDWIFAPLKAEQVPGSDTGTVIKPDEKYVSAMLNSFRIVDVRKGLKKFYGVVHSHWDIQGLGGPASFSVVTTPSELKAVDASRLDRVITMQKRLLGPVPYRGSDLELEIGLFSIKEADLAAPFLSLLEDLSGLAGTSFISAALPFAQPLQKGIAMLTGSTDDSILEVGLSRAFIESGLRTGHYLVMRAEKNAVDVSTLRVDPNDFKVLGPDNQPVSDFPYLLFQIEASNQRSDWFNIEVLKKAYDALREAVRKGDAPAIRDGLVVFRRLALTSDDLLSTDGAALADKVKAEIDKAVGPAATSVGRPVQLPEFRSLSLYQ